MAIFGKNKKNLKSLLKAISTLSDEEREELMNELFADDATDEGKNAEADKPTEGATQPAEPTQEPTKDNASVEADKPQEPQEPTQEVAPQNDYAKEFANLSEMLQALNTRFDEMDKKVAGYDDRLSAYDAYVAQKKDSIGAEQQINGSKKDINDMTADELAQSIRQGI